MLFRSSSTNYSIMVVVRPVHTQVLEAAFLLIWIDVVAKVQATFLVVDHEIPTDRHRKMGTDLAQTAGLARLACGSPSQDTLRVMVMRSLRKQ